jgi:hypothetical protein
MVVGANASGKSNLIETFRLLKKIYVEKDISPFSEWWGYNNVVWQRKEDLSITIGLLFEIEGYEVYFEITCTGAGGKFQILREILDIRDYVKVYKEGEWITIKHNKNFIDEIVRNFDEYEIEYGGKTTLRKAKDKLTQERKFKIDPEHKLLDKYFSQDVFIPWGGIKLIGKKTGNKLSVTEVRQPKIQKGDTFYARLFLILREIILFQLFIRFLQMQ